MVCIFLKIFEVFCLKICSQILIFGNSIMSKFIQKYKFLVAKNKKSLISINLLLLAVNLAIANFFQFIILLIIYKNAKVFLYFIIGNFALCICFFIKYHK